MLWFALGVHIYANNHHLYMSDVEGHSYMSRLSKHDIYLLKVAKHSFQVPLPNSRFLQESRSTTQGFILAVLAKMCADAMATGLVKIRPKKTVLVHTFDTRFSNYFNLPLCTTNPCKFYVSFQGPTYYSSLKILWQIGDFLHMSNVILIHIATCTIFLYFVISVYAIS